MKFNIFTKLSEDIDDFDNGGYYITGQPKSEVAYKQSKKGEKGGYYYSQKDTLTSIDLASASKYAKGIKDSEGQRKTFVNIVNFYRDVTKMKININSSNYIFEPTLLEYTWPVFLMERKFRIFVQEDSYDDQIDEYGHDLATYGTTVSKTLKHCSERVPLRTLRNTQSAKSLKHAAMTGGYVIIEDDKHYNEMRDYKGWILEGLSKQKSYNTFEYYTLVPKSLYENEAWKKNGGEVNNIPENEDMIPVQAILIPDEKDSKGNILTKGKIVWMEEVDEESFPLEECHTDRVDGRWLGRGEIEKQLENQIARNLTANLRRRGLLWAVKKIYQSSDDEVQRNLVMEVADGDILKVKPNGQISQVNTATQHLGEFTSDETMWKENSQQNAFAFNIATGENMPSGTSFSLGVVLERAVTDHFTMIRNTYSNFLKRCFFNQILDEFKEEYSEEHTQQISLASEGIENLKEQIIIYHVNERVFDKMAKRQKVDPDVIRQEVITEMSRNPYLFIDIPKDKYKNIHYYMKLNIDDDITADMNTLNTLYQRLDAKGDPRAETVLKWILAKQGKNLDAIVGVAPKPVAPVNPQSYNPNNPGNTPIPGINTPTPTPTA